MTFNFPQPFTHPPYPQPHPHTRTHTPSVLYLPSIFLPSIFAVLSLTPTPIFLKSPPLNYALYYSPFSIYSSTSGLPGTQLFPDTTSPVTHSSAPSRNTHQVLILITYPGNRRVQ